MAAMTTRTLFIVLTFSGLLYVFVTAYVLLSDAYKFTVFGYQYEKRALKPCFVLPDTTRHDECTNKTVIVVISKGSNFVRREVIRRTWGNSQMQINYNFKLYFLLGKERDVSLLNESLTRGGDIVQVDVIESYYNLTRKTIAALNWITHFSPNASFFFKTDDDVFLNLDILRDMNKNRNFVPDNVLVGTCYLNLVPHRNSTITRWAVSYEDYPNSTYPPYCIGGGYVMTFDTATRLYQEMNRSKPFVFEDVYVGMVAQKLGMSVKNIANFANPPIRKMIDNKRMLQYRNSDAVTHSLTPYEIQQLWDKRIALSCSKIDTHSSVYVLSDV